MSKFVVSARKYRPLKFKEVTGQSHITQTLKNAIANDHLAHAFLFCGPRGVGKTTTARILAKAINCKSPVDFEPCGTCESCSAFNTNSSFNISELDAASNNSVEHIRALTEQVRFPPQSGAYKIFIIDEVHMLSNQAFNAFLKTLEEPPDYAIFILATTEKHKIIPTILSRCQIFDFKRIQVEDSVDLLKEICEKEDIEYEEDALHTIAELGDGALRDALSVFDRLVSSSNEKLTYNRIVESLNLLDLNFSFKMVEHLLVSDLQQTILLFSEIVAKGFDPHVFLHELNQHFRNLLVSKDSSTLKLLEKSTKVKALYLEQAKVTPIGFILSALDLLNEIDINFKLAKNKLLHVEIGLIRIASVGLKRENNPNSTIVEPVIKKKVNVAEIKQKPIESKKITGAVQISKDKSVQNSKLHEEIPLQKKTIKQKNIAPTGSLGNKLESAGLNLIPDIDMTTQVSEKDINYLTSKKPIPLDLVLIKEIWDKYTEQIDSPSTKANFKTAKLGIIDGKISVEIASKMAESAILSEKEVLIQLRETFNTIDLTWELKIVRKAEEKKVLPKITWSPKDIFKFMADKNNSLIPFANAFDLNYK